MNDAAYTYSLRFVLAGTAQSPVYTVTKSTAVQVVEMVGKSDTATIWFPHSCGIATFRMQHVISVDSDIRDFMRDEVTK